MDVGPVSLSSTTQDASKKDISKFADVLSLYPVIEFYPRRLASCVVELGLTGLQNFAL